jgi:F-type H+-transporting ATPase subunit alpha
VKTLNQGERQPLAVEDQVAVIYAATNGYLDRIDAEKVPRFNRDLVERLHSAASDVLKQLAEGDWSDEVQKKLDEAIAEFAKDFGYDLDEEGLPEEEGRKRDEGKKEEDEEEEEERGEPVGAGARDE